MAIKFTDKELDELQDLLDARRFARRDGLKSEHAKRRDDEAKLAADAEAAEASAASKKSKK